MGNPVVGIDLGTSNTVIATVLNGQAMVIPDEEGRSIFPSIVHFPLHGAPIVGHDARPMRFNAPERTVTAAKRLIGRTWHASAVQQAARGLPYPIERGEQDVPLLAPGGVRLAIEEAQAMVLRHVRQVAERYLGEPVRDAVITVPANFNEAQRQATRLAGELAGLRVHRILNEPTAAALAYGHKSAQRSIIAVFDFGGGTFDITLLEVRGHIYEVLATAGDTFLGGEDLDGAIAVELERQARGAGAITGEVDAALSRRLRAVAEEIKIRLTEEEEVTLAVPELVPGSGKGASFRMDRGELQRTCMPILQQTFLVCDEALSLASVAATEIDRLLLVGGSTRSLFVRDGVEQYFFRKAEGELNPDEVVAIGAAIVAHTVMEAAEPSDLQSAPPEIFLEDDEIEFLDDDDAPSPVGAAPSRPRGSARALDGVTPLLIDVIPRALGVRTAGGYTDILIPRNATVPAHQIRQYATSRDRQTSVRLRIYEGEARMAEENHLLGELVLDGLRPAPRGDIVISVDFEVSVDGTLTVYAKDLETGASQRATLNVAGSHSADAIARMRERTQ